jgi:hypothetical protein
MNDKPLENRSGSKAPQPEGGKKGAKPSDHRSAAQAPAEGSDDLPPPKEGSPQA